MSNLVTLASGFNPNEELFKNLNESYTGIIQNLEHGKLKQSNHNSAKPYWEVTELDKDALKKAKKELQKANDSRS